MSNATKITCLVIALFIAAAALGHLQGQINIIKYEQGLLRNRVDAARINHNALKEETMPNHVWLITDLTRGYDDVMAVRPSRALAIQTLREHYPEIEEQGNNEWTTVYGHVFTIRSAGFEDWG